MIVPALALKEKVKELYGRAMFERGKWMSQSSYKIFNLDVKDDDWQQVQMVSIPKPKADDIHNSIPRMYMFANVDRHNNRVTNIGLIKLGDSKENNLEIAIDIKEFIEYLRDMGFVKMTFTTHVGSPTEKQYDKLTKKMGGRIVGTLKDHFKLMDGSIVDKKIYEVFF